IGRVVIRPQRAALRGGTGERFEPLVIDTAAQRVRADVPLDVETVGIGLVVRARHQQVAADRGAADAGGVCAVVGDVRADATGRTGHRVDVVGLALAVQRADGQVVGQ